MAHEAIEAQEEERIAEFTGQATVVDEDTPVMPEAGVPESQILFDGVDHTPGALDAQSPEMQGTDHVGGKDEPQAQAQAAQHIVEVVADGRSPAKLAEDKAREERRAFAEAQAKKFGKSAREAGQRGDWGSESFARPKDMADRLRRAVPYKYKVSAASLVVARRVTD